MRLNAEAKCLERGGGRVYFYEFGKPIVAKKSPYPFTQPFTITLKKASQELTIIILPQSRYSYILERKALHCLSTDDDPHTHY